MHTALPPSNPLHNVHHVKKFPWLLQHHGAQPSICLCAQASSRSVHTVNLRTEQPACLGACCQPAHRTTCCLYPSAAAADTSPHQLKQFSRAACRAQAKSCGKHNPKLHTTKPAHAAQVIDTIIYTSCKVLHRLKTIALAVYTIASTSLHNSNVKQVRAHDVRHTCTSYARQHCTHVLSSKSRCSVTPQRSHASLHPATDAADVQLTHAAKAGQQGVLVNMIQHALHPARHKAAGLQSSACLSTHSTQTPARS